MGGEAFLLAFLQVLVDKLAHREVFKYFGFGKGVDKKLKEWSADLSVIGALLNDAEERQLTAENNALKLWLDDLRDWALDAKEVLDKYRQIQHAHSSTTNKAWKSIPNPVSNFKMNLEIQKITDRLQEISERRYPLILKTDVSKMMGPATLVHNLVPMENDCLQVFEQHALSNANDDRSPNYEKIVAKYKGLPSAASAFGRVVSVILAIFDKMHESVIA